MSKKAKQEEVMTVVEEKRESNIPTNVLITSVSSQEMKELEDRKPVTGKFHLLGKKSGILKIGALRKYKEDPLKTWIFEHGKTYTIPKWMADWLNAAENEMKTPGCVKIKHVEQLVDLQKQHPLSAPEKEALYSFTPVTAW